MSLDEIALVQILSVLTLLPALFNMFACPLSAVQTITCKLRLPVLITLGIGIINFICVCVLLSTTNLGILGIKIVSSVLLMIRTLLFIPMYAAHNLGEKWTIFYPIIIRGTVTNMIMAGCFIAFVSVFDMNSWLRLVIGAGICGLGGYMINYIFLLDQSEKAGIRSMICSRLHLH